MCSSKMCLNDARHAELRCKNLLWKHNSVQVLAAAIIFRLEFVSLCCKVLCSQYSKLLSFCCVVGLDDLC